MTLTNKINSQSNSYDVRLHLVVNMIEKVVQSIRKIIHILTWICESMPIGDRPKNKSGHACKVKARRLFLQSQVTLISDVDRSKQQVETLHKASMDMNMSIFVKGKVRNNQDRYFYQRIPFNHALDCVIC